MPSSKLIICFNSIALLPLCFAFAALDEDLSLLAVEGIMTYNGLESCILNANSFQGESVTSRVDECPSDSLDEDTSSCSSSNNASGSFSSYCTMMKPDVQKLDEWDNSGKFVIRAKPSLTAQVSEMKEKFAKLLLGED
ncbi:Rop guanine nucleotide exchange factor 14, partial [Tanacetum coccineum]